MALGVGEDEHVAVLAGIGAFGKGIPRRPRRARFRVRRRALRGRRRAPRPRDGKGAQEAEVLLRADARARRLGVVVPRAVDDAVARTNLPSAGNGRSPR